MNKELIRKIFGLIKPYALLIILSFIAALVSIIMQLYGPILSGRAVDLITAKGQVDIDGVWRILIRFIIVVLIAAFAQWIMNLINNKVVYNVVCNLRESLFDHINRMPVGYIDSHERGDIISRILSDVDTFTDGLLMGFTQFFTGVITIFGILIFMFRVNFKVALVVVVLTPMSLFVAGFISKKSFDLFRSQSKKRAQMTELVNEMIGNEAVVQAFCYEDDAAERFEAINEDLSKAELSATFFSSLTNPSTRLINNFVYAGVGLTGALAVLTGNLSIGQLTCFLSYATQFAKPFNEISGVMTEIQNAFACASRIFELLEEETESDDLELIELDKVDGTVEIRDVDFSYNKEKELITDLSLSINPGQKVAIVGPTGSGKSTLINLLMRFYDVDKGDIYVDGNNIYDLKRKNLRGFYGMVLQETWLKSGTIKENIAYGHPDASEEEIINAAKITHADRFIRRLPKGYDTYISEDGGSLSEGQKQLLCITRVMLSLPPMLILDEATSSIDTRTEQRIQRSFIKMMKGRTTFIVAHRLSTIKDSDLILVMKDGSVIEQGTHESLLADNGFYKNLYLSQFTS